MTGVTMTTRLQFLILFILLLCKQFLDLLVVLLAFLELLLHLVTLGIRHLWTLWTLCLLGGGVFPVDRLPGMLAMTKARPFEHVGILSVKHQQLTLLRVSEVQLLGEEVRALLRGELTRCSLLFVVTLCEYCC